MSHFTTISQHLLLLNLLIPLAAALALSCGLRNTPAKLIALAGFLLPLATALHAAYWRIPDPDCGYSWHMTYNVGLSNAGISLDLGLNAIALPLYLLTAIVGAAAGLFALRTDAPNKNAYLALILAILSGALGIFSSIDLAFLYLFHEVALIPTFVLIHYWGARDRSYAAMQMALYLTLGAMLSLAGIIAIAHTTDAHTFNLIQLKQHLITTPLSLASQNTIAALLLIGLGALVSLFPLHSWAIPAYTSAPTPAAMLHAGVLKKFGLYLLLQLLPLLPTGISTYALPLAIAAVVGNLLIMGAVTLAQTHLKRLVASSSVMHMGYAFLGLATLSATGASSTLLFLVAHGLSISLLFLLSTEVQRRTGTFTLSEMGGLSQRSPHLALLFLAATFASIGLPGFANFWAELGIFVAAWTFSPALTILAVLGIIISATYALRAATKIFYGPPSQQFQQHQTLHPVTDLPIIDRLPAHLLLAALLILGLYPSLLPLQ